MDDKTATGPYRPANVDLARRAYALLCESDPNKRVVWEVLREDVQLAYLKATLDVRTHLFREGFDHRVFSLGEAQVPHAFVGFVAVLDWVRDLPPKS